MDEVLKAQLLIIRSYYSRIIMQQPNIDTIISWLQDDLNSLQMNQTLLFANNILEENSPHEASEVKCDACSYTWIAVRPLDTEQLECPNCSNTTNFENIGT
jgi:hypothetical protein